MFIRTGLFNPNEAHISVSASHVLIYPSDDTRDFLYLAHYLLEQLWQDGYRYAKAGITLSDFHTHNPYQEDLFDDRDIDKLAKSQQLMQTLDKINKQFGSHTLTFASEGIKQGTNKTWQMHRDMLFPCYTTDIRQIPKVF